MRCRIFWAQLLVHASRNLVIRKVGLSQTGLRASYLDRFSECPCLIKSCFLLISWVSSKNVRERWTVIAEGSRPS
ncbi:hypothetical protein TcWFU_000848 [Taenia crassiceps]|uniref:Secreted protein n=1 Tax=Taenia crassiceps TaxID=6207 RepID=A0ABR4QCW5_9CEST